MPLAVAAQTLTIVSGNNQTLVPNQASQPLVVQARDAQGAPLADAAIAWSSPNATADYSTSTKTDGSGQSTNRLTAILPGRYTLTASLVGSGRFLLHTPPLYLVKLLENWPEPFMEGNVFAGPYTGS